MENQKQAVNKIILLTIVLLLIAGIAGGYFLTSTKRQQTKDEMMTSEIIEEQIPTPTAEIIEDGDKVKSFVIEGKNFRFTPNELSVNRGDTVRITFKSIDMFHDLRFDGLDIGTNVLAAGQQETIEFIATEPGTFEFYCSVNTHRQMGMVGTLTVL